MKQKKKVQFLVKQEIHKYEKKITNEIRCSRDNGKNLWKNVNKLRGQSVENTGVRIYNEEGMMLENEEEERHNLRAYWSQIYNMHENKIVDEWTQDMNDYKSFLRSWNNNTHQKPFQCILPQIREHMDMALNVEFEINFDLNIKEHMDMIIPVRNEIAPMNDVIINEKKVKKHICSMKNGKSPGPDGLKIELYKELTKSNVCLKKMTECMREEYNRTEKPSSWKTSKTTMIPKTAKPMAKDLRPIALTDNSYKIFMSIIKEEIENHLTRNEIIKESQAGFSKGCRIEDNLFILNYCVEDAFLRKKSLIVTAIDYSKAFDSIDRSSMIEAMKNYKLCPEIINNIAEIYNDDITQVEWRKGINEPFKITNGIRQGCTASSVLFKILTYKIIDTIEETGRGYRIYLFKLTQLFFADDGLLLTETIEEAKEIIEILILETKKYGLKLNKEKSNILIFNMKDQPTDIENIKITNQIKYLGVWINNKRNLFTSHKEKMIQKAQKLANLTYSIIEKSVSKILIGKTYWKNVAIPSIFHADGILNINKTDIRKLQQIENGVYRKILGAAKYAPLCTLRGEIGASLVETRIMKNRLLYIKSINNRDNRLIKEILNDMKEREFKWIKEARKFAEEVGENLTKMEKYKTDLIKKKLREWDTQKWKQEKINKSTLQLYNKWKHNIEEARDYDNGYASVLLYKARSNTLPLNDRKRHQKKETKCEMCEAPLEDLEHFLLDCPALEEERRKHISLQRPQIEQRDDLLGRVLFMSDEAGEMKDCLQRMWTFRYNRINVHNH